MASAYCAQPDVVAFLPSGGLPNPARVATASAATDMLECEGHALQSGDAVTLRAMTGGSLPTGLSVGVTYYAIPVDHAHFQLAASVGGVAINLTTDGSNFVFVVDLPWAGWIDWASRQVDSFLPEHVTPLVSSPYPVVIVTAAAELAAMRGLQATSGAAIDLGQRIDAIRQRLSAWVKTIPIRGTAAQVHQPAQLAITASGGAYDPRGWAGSDPTRIP